MHQIKTVIGISRKNTALFRLRMSRYWRKRLIRLHNRYIYLSIVIPSSFLPIPVNFSCN